MENNFFNNFIENFFEAIENEFEQAMKKQKAKKLSVGNYKIDVIDYVSGSENPIIDSIKEGKDGAEIYLLNQSTSYCVEEIFHPFSLAALADKVCGEEGKYIKILENFYLSCEEMARNFLLEKNVRTFNIEDRAFEVLAVSGATGTFLLADGIVKDIFMENERVFLDIKNDDGEMVRAHIVECNASDLALLLNNLITPSPVIGG